MNAQLESIATRAAVDLQNLILEGESDILAAIHKVIKEAQLQESKPKFILGFKISVDYDKSTFDCDLSWTLKQSLGVSHTIEDKDQQNLKFDAKDRELAARVDAQLKYHIDGKSITN